MPSEMILPTDRAFNDRSLSWLGSCSHIPPAIGSTMVYVHPMTNAKDNDMDFLIEVIKKSHLCEVIY